MYFRRLSKEQKALLTAYAETEEGVNGTINGLAETNDGGFSFEIVI